jgi:hypothetical protein
MPLAVGLPRRCLDSKLEVSRLGITSIYLQGVDSAEFIDTSTPAAGR